MIKEIVLEIITDQPQLQKEIVNKVRANGVPLNTRALRDIFKEINTDFINGKCDFGIISNSQGSYKSSDPLEIIKFNDNKIKHAKSELWSAYNMNKQINNNKNLSFMEYLEMEMKGYGK